MQIRAKGIGASVMFASRSGPQPMERVVHPVQPPLLVLRVARLRAAAAKRLPQWNSPLCRVHSYCCCLVSLPPTRCSTPGR